MTNKITYPANQIDAECYGCTDTHVCVLEGSVSVHIDLLRPLAKLQQAARQAGFELGVASGYRSFERQSQIWNAKFNGLRPVVDENGLAVQLKALNPLDHIEKIMLWSALPGSSRHHWGTDMDVYDRSAVPADYNLQLIPEEYRDNGPFAPMMRWLQAYLVVSSEAQDFFFPYSHPHGGVKPEPWHLSYRPLARRYARYWSQKGLISCLSSCQLAGKTTILDNLDMLHQRFLKPSLYPEER